MELNRELKLNKDGIMDIRRPQRNVAAMDANYTKEELAGAQRSIAHFEFDVATGSKVFQRMGRPMLPEWMRGPRLSGPAEWDYVILKERIETSRSMILDLQQHLK
ncbi:hypothetical protein ACMS1V_000186 [Cronobacter dublinensis]